ncbi:hypothetical protein LTR56_006831 [Elasticomyces elasticus]|nr:hypothetical protein LTR56_006831 [Elasticomyces elasticus]KAK3659517.1 hypothetical protein LTR22_008434 [Elasticomyces elasticus]KAK4923245.1 hypothetical protein LTR49_009508 [Elasticomyces elasticus]KAK5757652.1 hypothetical protein LTS12_012254 [Elasticomyces elasticus]
MCKFQELHYACGTCSVISVLHPCEKSYTDAQGKVSCSDDPRPHGEDGKYRVGVKNIFSPATCSGVVCQWEHGILAHGDYGVDKAFKAATPFTDDEESRTEREQAWFRMLTTEQQLECMNTIFPLSIDGASDYARAWLRSDGESIEERQRLRECSVVQSLDWRETNPRYLSPRALQKCTGYLLPAIVTAPGHEGQAITPHLPIVGPFACDNHKCKPFLANYRICGRFNGLRGSSAGYDAAAPRKYRSIDAAVHHFDQQIEEDNREWEEMLEQAEEGSKVYGADRAERQVVEGAESAFVETSGDAMDIDSCFVFEV